MMRRLCMVSLTIFATLSGCSQFGHETQKVQAEKHWRSMRAGIKHQLASQQFESGNLEDAETSAREAIGLDASMSDYYLTLARIRIEQSKLVEATQALEMCTTLGGPLPEASYLKGMLAERIGNLAEAYESYNIAWQADCTKVEYLLACIESLIGLNRLAEADRLLADSRQGFEGNNALSAIAGELAVMLGDEDKAMAEYAEAFSRTPGDAELAEAYGLLLSDNGRHVEAVAVLSGLEDRPDRPLPRAVTRSLAGGYLAMGDAISAQKIIGQHTKRHPDDAAGWMVHAEVALKLRNLITARGAIETACRLVPESSGAQMLKGYTCWAQKQYRDAEQALSIAIKLSPTDTLIHCLLGQVYLESARPDQAREYFRRALQIDPTCEWAREAIAQDTGPVAPPLSDTPHPAAEDQDHG